MDAELQETVEQLVGAGAQVLDCEKRSVVREEEVLLVNGQPLQLQGADGVAIRKALLAGHVPHDLLNTVLVRAGILRSPVRLETSLQVKSSVVTREEVTVARGGRVVDEHSRQTQEDNVYNSSTTETWEPAPAAGAAAPAAAASAALAAPRRPGPPRHGKAQAPPPPLTAAGGGPLTQCASPPLSSSSSSGFWSPGPGGPAPSRSVSDSSCDSGPPPRPPQPPTSASPGDSDDVDGDLAHGLHAVSLPSGSGGLGLSGSPPHNHFVSISGQEGVAGPSGCSAGAPGSSHGPAGLSQQLKRSNSRPCNVPGCTQPGCSRMAMPAQRVKEHTMVYREDTLVAGALEALVRHAIPTAEYFPEDAYMFAFILCARMFVPLEEVLLRVIRSMDRCKSTGDERRCAALGRNVLRFLREWSDSFAYDYREERMMALCIEVTQRLVELLPDARREVSELQTDLLAKLTAVETYEEFLNRCGDVRYVDSVEELTASDVMDMVRTPTKLAQQLTHIELERLSHIGPEEFVLAFMKERGLGADGGGGGGEDGVGRDSAVTGSKTGGGGFRKTRCKEAYEDWFSRLSYLVATEICKHSKKKQRLRVLDFWVQTARECYNIGNFNSLMAINAGLSLAPVARLRKTWSKVHCVKCFTVLQNLMSMSDNYKSYRSTLAAAIKHSRQQNVAAQVPGAHPPQDASNDYIVVPFFYLLVKDLHFLNVGCADKLPNGHINFEKFWQLAKQVTEFIAWKQAVCPFPKNTDVIMYLQTSPLLTDNALALASFECEAADNAPEKEHYKSLKEKKN